MSQSEPITCRQLIEFIADYLDGSLPPVERHEFDRHLRVCPSCVAYLASYQRTIELGRSMLSPTEESASKFVPEGVIEAMRLARSSQG